MPCCPWPCNTLRLLGPAISTGEELELAKHPSTEPALAAFKERHIAHTQDVLAMSKGFQPEGFRRQPRVDLNAQSAQASTSGAYAQEEQMPLVCCLCTCLCSAADCHLLLVRLVAAKTCLV